jgi:predicted transcriptional regulator
LLSAFVSNNTIESSDLAGLIQTTHAALAEINAPPAAEPAAPEYAPAVTVRKSLASRDHIISLIDGKAYKTLKRHLSGHGLTPSEYRERYGLPKDYPMVAPSYSDHRRDVAQRLGLGRRPALPDTGAADAKEKPVALQVDPAAAATATADELGDIRAKPKAAMEPAAKKALKPAPKRVAAKAAAPIPQTEAPTANDAVEPVTASEAAGRAPARKKAASKGNTVTPEVSTAEDGQKKPKSAPAERGRSNAKSPAEPAE